MCTTTSGSGDMKQRVESVSKVMCNSAHVQIQLFNFKASSLQNQHRRPTRVNDALNRIDAGDTRHIPRCPCSAQQVSDRQWPVSSGSTPLYWVV
jgi:hypothetical protein